MRRTKWIAFFAVFALAFTFLAIAPAQPQGKGKGKGKGFGKDASHQADMELFHYLLDHRDAIKRTVVKRDDGIETVTESNDPKVAETIQKHVTSMKKRVEEGRGIHLRDPLFAELFRNAKKIEFKYEKTETGVKVTETSKDAHAVKLLQAHADVVSLFLKNGHAEVMKNHAIPK